MKLAEIYLRLGHPRCKIVIFGWTIPLNIQAAQNSSIL